MNTLPRVAAIALLALAPQAAAAARPRALPTAPTNVRVTDVARRLDVNSLNCFVTNVGSLGYDLLDFAGGGLYFPKGTNHSVLFASGLWIGGVVGGAPRVALAEYTSEFQPGSMMAGSYDDPARPEYAVWKVLPWKGNPADTAHADRAPADLAADPTLDPVAHHGWSEYLANAAPHGAPVTTWLLPDGAGGTVPVRGPAVLGDQMLWCVFNDANPSAHTSGAGGTPPLGLEVRQSVFAYAGTGAAGQTAFVRWKIFNRGLNALDSVRAGFWADPDVGGYTDDLAGCDSLRSLGFAYNATNNDLVYGATPPAVGVDLLNESYDAARGRFLGMTSFARYFNGIDPLSSVESWNVLNGLQRSGMPILDPFTLAPLWYACPGDPLLGTGWLDTSPADRRMLLARGPRPLAIGDSLEIWAAIVVAQGNNRLASVQLLDCWSDWAQAAYAAGFPPVPPADQNCGAVPPFANCPRPLGFYQAECQGPVHLTPSQMQALATAIDLQSRTFAWPSGPDGATAFCSVLDDESDVRAIAKGQYATLLANALAQSLGIIPAGTSPIALDLLAPVAIPGLAATTVTELIAPVGPPGLNADYENLNAAHRTPIEGVDLGTGVFGGGAAFGYDFFGSSLDPAVSPGSFHTVHVVFDASKPQKAYRFLRLEVEGTGAAPPQGRAYLYGGFVDVPFEVIDAQTGWPLDVAFTERAVCDANGTILDGTHQPATFDSTWAPDASSLGGREYLFVFSLPYGGSPRPEIATDGSVVMGTLPVLYNLWSRRLEETDVFDDGDRFYFRFGPVSGPGADGRLFELEGQPLSDPAVQDAYRQLILGLAALNRGDGLATVCDDPTPALASLVSATADPGRVRIEWYVDAPGEVGVERSSEPGAWLAAGTAAPDGAGHVVWQDASVEAGERYGYRLALGSGGGAPYGGEVWVDVPREARLAIAGLAPNPGGPDASVVFTLASRERASLEIVDLAGRRVFAREVGALGPGTHALSLGGRMAPGVYWLRLEQGARRVTARGVIVR